MKAMQFAEFGGPEVLRLEEIPSPRPGPHEVLIDIEAASVTPGDWKLRAGHLRHFFTVALPCVPGRDGAGIVAAVGDQVDYARVGEAVCFVADRTKQGSYADRIVRDAGSIVPLPPNLSFSEGAALTHAGTFAWTALTRFARLKPGERVLVHAGAGAIGGVAVQLARHFGAEVFATCSGRNVDYVRELGAGVVIPYDRDDFTTRVRGCDVVLDLVGGEVHRRSYEILKPGGRLVWLQAAPIEDLSVKFGVQTIAAGYHDDTDSLASVMDLAASGVLKPQVSRVMPLDQAAEAHRLMEDSRNSRGRMVLDIRGIAVRRRAPKANAP